MAGLDTHRHTHTAQQPIGGFSTLLYNSLELVNFPLNQSRYGFLFLYASIFNASMYVASTCMILLILNCQVSKKSLILRKYMYLKTVFFFFFFCQDLMVLHKM